MKPLMLHGHERSITQIKYNREGDLLFSCAKDNTPNVWYSLNGERLGTFNGHSGAVWCVDVNWDTTRVLSGAADNTLIIWDTQTGTPLAKQSTKSAVRSCNFSYSGKMAMYTTDKQMGHQCEIVILDVTNDDVTSEPILKIPVTGPKVTSALWGPLDEYFITGHENGDLIVWETKTGDQLNIVKEHSKTINDLQYNKDQMMFITASKDHTAKLFDTSGQKLLKTFKTERPVNSAAISPLRDHVVLGGGQEASEVTTTSARIGKFDARFFHLVFEEEFGRVKGHFGPINSVTFHPDGRSYSSGGEDGYVRIQNFDPQYFEYQFEF